MLTPHAGELAPMLDVAARRSSTDAASATEAASRWDAVVLLEGRALGDRGTRRTRPGEQTGPVAGHGGSR